MSVESSLSRVSYCSIIIISFVTTAYLCGTPVILQIYLSFLMAANESSVDALSVFAELKVKTLISCVRLCIMWFSAKSIKAVIHPATHYSGPTCTRVQRPYATMTLVDQTSERPDLGVWARK